MHADLVTAPLSSLLCVQCSAYMSKAIDQKHFRLFL